VQLADGGGTYDQRAIVDLSFLDLVRLGVRRPDDPNILATLEVAESALEVKTAQGERYYRYTHDGYGEGRPGAAPDGHGQLWPLLIGEWSIYQVARTHSESPASWYMSEMWATANQGGMLPEQVFPDGSGTGAATPLARAHAEYILFINAIKQAAVPDMPAVVAKRYLQ
jgi:glucoamylase